MVVGILAGLHLEESADVETVLPASFPLDVGSGKGEHLQPDVADHHEHKVLHNCNLEESCRTDHGVGMALGVEKYRTISVDHDDTEVGSALRNGRGNRCPGKHYL